jgi:hypothetical protein
MVFTSDEGPLGRLLEDQRIGTSGVAVEQIPDLLSVLAWDANDSERAIAAYNTQLAVGRPNCELSEVVLGAPKNRPL